MIDFLKRRKEIIDNKGNKVVFKDMGTAVEFIDCTNGVNLAVILGEILGKTRDEVIKDIGLKSYNDTFRYF